MKKNASLMAVFVLTFIACAKPQSSSNAKNPQDPTSATLTLDGEKASENQTFELKQDFRKEAMSAEPLSEEDKATAIKPTNGNPKYLSNFSFFFVDPQHLDKEGPTNQKDFAELPDAGKVVFATVRSSCKLVPPTSVAAPEVAQANLLSFHASITGDSCPISFDSQFSENSKYTAFDPATHMRTGQVFSKKTENSSILNPDLAKTTLTIKSSISLRQKAFFKNFVPRIGSQPALGNASIASSALGDIYQADGTKLSVRFRTEISYQEGKKQVQALSKSTLPNGKKLVIGLFLNDGKVEALLNGVSYPYSKIKQEFGTSFSALE